MIAEPHPQDQDVEVVDLDAMTVEQLDYERGQVRIEIAKIETQLADEERKLRMGDDYEEWRGRARVALQHKHRERIEIHWARERAKAREEEASRQQREEERLARMRANGWDPDRPPKVKCAPPPPRHTEEEKQALRAQWEAAREASLRKRAALLAALGADGTDALLARVYCAIRHLAGGDDLPPSVTNEDRRARAELGAYLRSKFGSGALRAMYRGTLTAETGDTDVAP